MRAEGHFVLAALDRGLGTPAVQRVAAVVAEHFRLPVRFVHVTTGPGPRGAARQAATARVERGETDELTGRPVDILTGLVESPRTAMAVFGTGSPLERPSPKRPSGTAFAVARRVTRSMLLVPPSLAHWDGPRRVLVPLDGTGVTALAASAALAELREPDTVATTVHVVEHGTVAALGDDAPQRMEALRSELRDRYQGALGEGLEVRTGQVAAHLTDMAASDGFDMVVVVWSQQTRGGRAAVVADLLARTAIPILLVPATSVAHTLGGGAAAGFGE
ncbi:MAG TPA: universal stress protein [Acidimicrobiales bacterium]|nr:universal stress protein [Acidimicrobiales bacterium]